jgi:hypothetical protein
MSTHSISSNGQSFLSPRIGIFSLDPLETCSSEKDTEKKVGTPRSQRSPHFAFPSPVEPKNSLERSLFEDKTSMIQIMFLLSTTLQHLKVMAEKIRQIPDEQQKQLLKKELANSCNQILDNL